MEFLQQKELLALQDDKPILETFGDVKLQEQLDTKYQHMYEEEEEEERENGDGEEDSNQKTGSTKKTASANDVKAVQKFYNVT